MSRKVVLYNPKPNINLKSKDIPLALLFISKMLTTNNYQVKIFSDLDQPEEILNQAEDALCLGITSMTGHQIIDGLNLAKAVRKRNSKLPLVWGGWHASLMPEQTLEDEHVDIVVRGQGERTFYELVKRLENDEDLKGLPGVSYKHQGGVGA